jgi:Protein of unknown function (DUF3040)
VGDADETIVLTEQEREALAGLAAAIGDPWLAGQLAGGGQTPTRPKPPSPWLRLAATGWAGLVLLLAGAALAVTTFIHSVLVATLGLVVMGVGLWRFVDQHGDGVMRRVDGRRTRAAGATPPRTLR